jgi:hypothetical protein
MKEIVLVRLATDPKTGAVNLTAPFSRGGASCSACQAEVGYTRRSPGSSNNSGRANARHNSKPSSRNRKAAGNSASGLPMPDQSRRIAISRLPRTIRPARVTFTYLYKRG